MKIDEYRYLFMENDVYIKAEEHTLIALARALREAQVEGTLSDLAYQIEYFFDIDGIQSEEAGVQSTPCDNGECPYNAQGGYDCRNYCGLGVDECGDDEYYDYEEDEEYVPSASNGDYSPSNPWDAPGMKISDFI